MFRKQHHFLMVESTCTILNDGLNHHWWFIPTPLGCSVTPCICRSTKARPLRPLLRLVAVKWWFEHWLVVYLPLRKIWVRQLGWWHSQLLWESHSKFHGFQTTNRYIYYNYGKSQFLVGKFEPSEFVMSTMVSPRSVISSKWCRIWTYLWWKFVFYASKAVRISRIKTGRFLSINKWWLEPSLKWWMFFLETWWFNNHQKGRFKPSKPGLIIIRYHRFRWQNDVFNHLNWWYLMIQP